MQIRVFTPKSESIFQAIVTLGAQIGIFFGGVYALWQIYNPTPTAGDQLVWSFYPYLGFELVLFSS
jgi:hypothetical protein